MQKCDDNDDDDDDDDDDDGNNLDVVKGEIQFSCLTLPYYRGHKWVALMNFIQGEFNKILNFLNL